MKMTFAFREVQIEVEGSMSELFKLDRFMKSEMAKYGIHADMNTIMKQIYKNHKKDLDK